MSEHIQNSDIVTLDTVSAVGRDIKEALAADIRECRLSREAIAEELSRLSGRDISPAQLDAYVAQSKTGHRFPAELVALWVKVTRSQRVLALLCEQAGLWCADVAEHELAELGRAQIMRERAEEKAAGLKRKYWDRFDV